MSKKNVYPNEAGTPSPTHASRFITVTAQSMDTQSVPPLPSTPSIPSNETQSECGHQSRSRSSSGLNDASGSRSRSNSQLDRLEADIAFLKKKQVSPLSMLTCLPLKVWFGFAWLNHTIQRFTKHRQKSWDYQQPRLDIMTNLSHPHFHYHHLHNNEDEIPKVVINPYWIHVGFGFTWFWECIIMLLVVVIVGC